jgi:hypothetical protein
MVKIDFAIQTSERTRNRLPLLENWTRHVQKPSTVRFVIDEQVSRGDYLSAIDKTIYAIDTFQPHYDWLYIVDDDGYVIPRRLELRLIDLNPAEQHAIGSVQGVLTYDAASTQPFPDAFGDGSGLAVGDLASQIGSMTLTFITGCTLAFSGLVNGLGGSRAENGVAECTWRY